MKRLLNISIFCVCLTLLCYFTLSILFNKSFYIDGLNTFFNTVRFDFFITFFEGITILGDWKFILLLSFLILMFINDKKKAICLIVAVLIIMSVNLGLKNIIKRDRPYGMLVHESGFSFPSAHAMISCFFWFFLADNFTFKSRNRVIGVLVWIGCLIIVVTVALSRVYLNVHYCSDVIAGVLMGVALLIAFKYICYKFIFKVKH